MTQKIAICAPSHNFVEPFLRNWGIYRQLEKKLLNSNNCSTYFHNMANFRPLTAEIRWWVWDTPANLNGLRVLASLLHRRRSPEANQTLHDVWSSHGLVHYIHFRGLLPLAEYCPVQNWLYLQVLRSPILAALYCTTLQQRASAKLRGVQQRAPPIFSRVAITFGIGPHFSSISMSTLFYAF